MLAVARLIEWIGTNAEFEKSLHHAAHSRAVILADPHLWSGSEPRLVSFASPHRWWAEAELVAGPSPGTSLTPLHNQPLVETRFLGGAMRLMDLREPASKPPLPDSPPGLPEPTPIPPLPAYDAKAPVIPLTAEGRAVGDFLTQHHRKATIGDVRGLVADYADRVQFLRSNCHR